ncbi:MAG: ATP-binding cassette domain-containing protein [Candidatus Saccharicenans sp.]
MNSAAIEARGLTKKFGNFTAVDHISLSINYGRIFGFLGANGAGKSTTIRMLCGLMRPSAGWARVAGYDVLTEADKIKKIIGYMSQKFSLYQDLTVEENLEFFGRVYGLNGYKLRDRMELVKDRLGLRGMENKLSGKMPSGWKQKLALGCAILHDPRIIFLDEPTGGVDPISRREFWKLIYELAEEGRAILVTTHYLDEAEYCHEISLIHAGRIIASGSPWEMKKNYFPGNLLELTGERPLELYERLKTWPEVRGLSLFGTKLHILTDKDNQEKILSKLKELNLSFSVRLIVPTLEDVFIHQIEKESKRD